MVKSMLALAFHSERLNHFTVKTLFKYCHCLIAAFLLTACSDPTIKPKESKNNSFSLAKSEVSERSSTTFRAESRISAEHSAEASPRPNFLANPSSVASGEGNFSTLQSGQSSTPVAGSNQSVSSGGAAAAPPPSKQIIYENGIPYELIEVDSTLLPVSHRIPEVGETPLSETELSSISNAMDSFDRQINDITEREGSSLVETVEWNAYREEADDKLRSTLGWEKFNSLSREAVVAELQTDTDSLPGQ